MKHLPLRTGTLLMRESPFAYRCGACSRCCRDKAIPINPYEIARMAGYLGLSTTEFIAKHTSLGGSILKQGPTDEACPFLGPHGCGIHAARPLACRLYPLGRHMSAAGVEEFAEVQPHPQSEGDWSGTGTVADYLHAQQTEAYLEASDRYFALLKRMIEALERFEEQSPGEHSTSVKLDNWLDIEAVLLGYCAARHVNMPGDPGERMLMHIQAIDELLSATG